MNESLGDIIYTSIKIYKKKIVLAKPVTYMNRSGRGISSLQRKFDFDNHEMFVIYDDIDIPLEDIRIRKRGGAGNHKGMMSIIDEIGNQDFPRIRIGIKDTEKKTNNIVDYVLSPLDSDKLASLQVGIQKAVEAMISLLKSDIDFVMNKYNSKIDSLLPEEGG